MDQSLHTQSDLELLFAKFVTELRSDIQKDIEESSTKLRSDIQKDIEESSTKLRSDIQKDIEESLTELRSDIQKVEKQIEALKPHLVQKTLRSDIQKDIEESSTKLRSDIQKDIEESLTELRSDIQKVEKQIKALKPHLVQKTLLLQKIREEINGQIAAADQNIVWMLCDADNSLGKRVKAIDGRLHVVSMQDDINRLLGRTSSQDAMSHRRAISADRVGWGTLQVRRYLVQRVCQRLTNVPSSEEVKAMEIEGEAARGSGRPDSGHAHPCVAVAFVVLPSFLLVEYLGCTE